MAVLLHIVLSANIDYQKVNGPDDLGFDRRPSDAAVVLGDPAAKRELPLYHTQGTATLPAGATLHLLLAGGDAAAAEAGAAACLAVLGARRFGGRWRLPGAVCDPRHPIFCSSLA